MGRYQIVCTRQWPPNEPPDHARIVEVGLPGGDRLYRVDDIVTWIDRREHEFYTVDPYTGLAVGVVTCHCAGGTRQHIKTKPNQTKRDNLDSLPRCP